MKTTKAQVEQSRKEAKEAFQYHQNLPENQQWKNAPNLKKFQAKFYMLSEALKLGM